jgi:hypothetical protein
MVSWLLENLRWQGNRRAEAVLTEDWVAGQKQSEQLGRLSTVLSVDWSDRQTH